MNHHKPCQQPGPYVFVHHDKYGKSCVAPGHCNRPLGHVGQHMYSTVGAGRVAIWSRHGEPMYLTATDIELGTP